MGDPVQIDERARQGGGHHAALASAQPGDWLEVDAIPGGDPRRGEILEVIGAGDHLHFRVRWDEGHESLLYPAPEGGIIVHSRRDAAKGTRP